MTLSFCCCSNTGMLTPSQFPRGRAGRRGAANGVLSPPARPRRFAAAKHRWARTTRPQSGSPALREFIVVRVGPLDHYIAPAPVFASRLAVLSFMRLSISSIEDSLSASRSTSPCAPPASAPGGPDAPPSPCNRGFDAPPVELGCFLALGGRMKSSGCSKTCLLDRRPP